MGRFLNPGNSVFQRMLNSEIYVDKTGVIEYTNKVMDTEQSWICNSRPRRFGKSVTANMLAAYYSCGCDSENLFADTEISRKPSFKEHLNKYDVIYFDVQWFCMELGSSENLVEYITMNIIDELNDEYPEAAFKKTKSLAGILSYISNITGRKFVVIIDEWDVLIRDESQNHAVQDKYINFLRSLFKGTEPSKYLHLAYLTGILPIKK